MSPIGDTKGGSKSWVECCGWWQQDGLGDQEMKPLRVSLSNGKLEAIGTDICGPFTMTGWITTGGAVHIVKKYTSQHSVDYFGQYDEKGTLYGDWEIDDQTGKWEIQLPRERVQRKVRIRQIEMGFSESIDRQLAI